VALPASAVAGAGLAPAGGTGTEDDGAGAAAGRLDAGELAPLAVGAGATRASSDAGGGAVAGDWLGWAELVPTVAGCAGAPGRSCAATSLAGGWPGIAEDGGAAVACGVGLCAADEACCAAELSLEVGGAESLEASRWLRGAASASAVGGVAGVAGRGAGLDGGVGSDAIWCCAWASWLRVHSCVACIGARLLIDRAKADATALVAFTGGELPEVPLADPVLAPAPAGAADPDEDACACDAPDCPAAADCSDAPAAPLAPP
jgi:hypothetical protein